MALLGSGFDPGVTNVFCAYVQKHLLDEVHYVDIVDCNARLARQGVRDELQSRDQHPRDHGARPLLGNGEWKETDPL